MTYQDRPMGQPPRPSGRRKGRRARKLTIVFVVLAIVLVGADFGASAIAEHQISQKAREKLKLADDPSVNIHGFPFATQAISGNYSHITVRAGGIPVKDLRDVELTAELRDVQAPLSDLLNGKTDSIKINKLDGQVKIKTSDIAKLDPINKVDDLKIEPSTEEYVKTGEDNGRGGSDKTTTTTTSSKESQSDSKAGVRLSGYVNILNQRTQIFAFAMLEIDGKSIRISPQRLQFGRDKQTTVVPKEVQATLLPNFEVSIDPGDLPFSVTPTAVKVEDDSVTVSGEAKNVTFAGGSTASG